MDQGRYVAVDYGTKRVGIAITDPLGLFPQPHGTFSPGDAVEEIVRIADEDGLRGIVIGWPVEADGTEGKATQRVQQYINRLRNRLPKVPIVKWDERYTTIEARDRIRAADQEKKHLKRKGHPGRVDEAAAGLMLQEFLNQQ